MVSITGRVPDGTWQLRLPTRRRLFTASTLSRALQWDITESALADATSSTVDRWYGHDPAVDPDVLGSLAATARRVAGLRPVPPDPGHALPSDNACLEATRRQGGLAKALYDSYSEHKIEMVMRSVNAANDELRRCRAAAMAASQRVRTPQELLLTATLTRQLTLMRWVHGRNTAHNAYATQHDFMRADEEINNLVDELRERDPQPWLHEAYREAQSLSLRETMRAGAALSDLTPSVRGLLETSMYDISTSQHPVRPVAIPERGGKVRVASIHPASHTYLANQLNRRLIPILRSVRATRRRLNGQTVMLRRDAPRRGETQEPLYVYSADWSKASDYMPHKVAQTILRATGAVHRWTQDEIAAATALAGPQLPAGRSAPTTRGAHMGLGTTWYCLNICNIWCARFAPPDSFETHGDDLIALWTLREIAAYEASVTAINLRYNRSKSHRDSRHGVFCEEHVTRSGDYVAISRPQPKMGDLTHLHQPPAAFGAPQENPRDVTAPLERLHKLGKQMKCLERLRQRSLAEARRGTARRLARGPRWLSGDGTAPTKKEHLPGTLKALRRALEKGRFTPQAHPDVSPVVRHLHETVATSERPKNGYSTTELNDLLRSAEAQRRLATGVVIKPQLRRPRSLRAGTVPTHPELQAAIKGCRWLSSRARRRCLNTMRRMRPCSSPASLRKLLSQMVPAQRFFRAEAVAEATGHLLTVMVNSRPVTLARPTRQTTAQPTGLWKSVPP